MDAIIRKYNYRLETGTVGTDDDNIANVLYNINRMEMNESYFVTDAEDEEELDEDLEELFFMVVDSKVHLNRFLEEFKGKTDAQTAAAVIAAFDEAMEIVREGRANQDDVEKASAVFPKVYKKLLAIVPSILALDAQAVGRVGESVESGAQCKVDDLLVSPEDIDEQEHPIEPCSDKDTGNEPRITYAEWLRKAEEGDAEAQCKVGDMLVIEDNDEEDHAEGVKWYGKAAKQNHAAAQYKLALAYGVGFGGVREDMEQFWKLLRKSAGQGYAEAQFYLGELLYGDGNGAPEDKAEGIKWVRKAAAQGHKQAQSFLDDLKEREEEAQNPKSQGCAALANPKSQNPKSQKNPKSQMTKSQKQSGASKGARGRKRR